MLLQSYVRLSKPHTLKTEVRHFWNKFADSMSCGRGIGIQMLSTRFMSRDMRQNRASLNAVTKSIDTEQNGTQKSPDKKTLKSELRSVGCPHAFQLFTQQEIRKRKLLGQWDPACVEILKDEDGSMHRSEAGKQFVSEMSRAWADAKTTPAGQRVQEEAKANQERRRQFKAALARIEEHEPFEDDVLPRVVDAEFGFGSTKVPVTAEACAGVRIKSPAF